MDALTVAEAAAYLGVSRTKVWQLIREGTLPSTQNPLDKRQRLILRRDIERLAANGRRPSRQPPRVASTSSASVQSGEVNERPKNVSGPGQHPRPRTRAMYAGPLAVTSNEVEDYLREHWNLE